MDLTKESLVSKFPSCGRWSWLVIMSTTLSCQPHHQAVRKSKGAGACEFTGENTFGRQALCFTGMEAPGVAKVGSVFPRVGGLDLGKLSTKSARDCSESSICTSKYLIKL